MKILSSPLVALDPQNKTFEGLTISDTKNRIYEHATRETQLFTIALSREQCYKVTETSSRIMKEQKCKSAEALLLICEQHHSVNKENSTHVQNGE